MAGKNDILASAGIDVEAFKAQIDTLIKESKRAGDSVASVDKQVSSLSRTLGGLGGGSAAIAFGTGFINNITGANVALGDTAELFKQMKFDALGLGKGGTAWLGDLKNTSIDFLRTIKLGAVADFADRGQKQTRDAVQITKALGEQSESYDALIAKRQKLIAMKATEEAKPQGSRSTPDSVKRLSNGIAEIDEKLVKIGERRLALQFDQNAGREQEIALNELDMETKQKLADLDEKTKNVIGLQDKDAAKTLATQKAAIEIEADQKKKLILISKQQEVSEKERLDTYARKGGITWDDEKARHNADIAANMEVVAQLKEQGMENTILMAQAKEKLRVAHLAFAEADNAYKLEIAVSENNTRAIEAHLSGNQKLADLEKNRAQYQIQIAEAIRHGKDELAEQLRRQERLNELEIKARDLLKTPQQRVQERREQEKMDAAQRTVNAREKDVHDRAEALRRGNPRKFAGMSDDQILGRTDSRDHVSKATAKARAEFAARQKGAPAQHAANMALQNITAATIIVSELKPAP